MALKKSIVFFGAVLVLAACDRATAPTGPLSLHDGAAASVKKDTTRSINKTSTMALTGCYWVREGSDSVQVCEPQIQ